MNFDQAFEHLVGVEGQYVNDPNDSGGETCWGITVAVARAHGYKDAMKDMPIAVAKAIYKTDFWNKFGCEYIRALYPRLAYEVFESSVNLPFGLPIKWLQTALNAFNNRQQYYPDIVVDGDFGPATNDALTAYHRVRKAEGETILLEAMNSQQGAFYLGLVARREKDESFVYGWFKNRVAA